MLNIEDDDDVAEGVEDEEGLFAGTPESRLLPLGILGLSPVDSISSKSTFSSA